MAKSRSFGGLIVIAVVLALAAGGWDYWRLHRDTGPRFYTATVSRGNLVENVTAAGIIQPLLDVLVSSQISGYVDAWYADYNAKVKKGDLLLTLLPTNYQAAVESAQGNLDNAKANYSLQQVTLVRDKELLAQHLLAQSDYDTQAAQVAEAAAQIEIQQANLDTAEANLSYCRITSPIDGFVIARDVNVGNSVAASLSAPTLYEIGNDLTKMQIDASVAEADIGTVADGQDVAFTVDAYPNREFHGQVYQVRNAPETQQNVVIYDVMINVDNRDLKLKPGMTANTSIVVARRSNAVCVPNSALRFRMPEDIATTTAPAPAAAGAAAAAAGPGLKPASRDDLRELFQEAGFQRGGGPPSPEAVQKLKNLAEAKGLEIPERMLAFLQGRGRGGAGGGNPDIPVFRTVYRLPGGSQTAEPEAVRVRIGVTDGTNTEVLGGLQENDVLITGLTEPTGTTAPSSSPFGGHSRGF